MLAALLTLFLGHHLQPQASRAFSWNGGPLHCPLSASRQVGQPLDYGGWRLWGWKVDTSRHPAVCVVQDKGTQTYAKPRFPGHCSILEQ